MEPDWIQGPIKNYLLAHGLQGEAITRCHFITYDKQYVPHFLQVATVSCQVVSISLSNIYKREYVCTWALSLHYFCMLVCQNFYLNRIIIIVLYGKQYLSVYHYTFILSCSLFQLRWHTESSLEPP